MCFLQEHVAWTDPQMADAPCSACVDAPPKCSACGAEAKYRCPACDVRSCSLACVNRHKQERPCTGRRNPAEYHAIGEFDDRVIHGDYRFLEGTLRAVDSARRRRRDTDSPAESGRRPGQSLPPARHNLLKKAQERGVWLELLPQGMRRQTENTTRYDGRRRQICWRVEVLFGDAGIRHVLPAVPESARLGQMLRSLLEPDVSLMASEAPTTPAGALPAALPAGEPLCASSMSSTSPDAATAAAADGGRAGASTAAAAAAVPSAAAACSHPIANGGGSKVGGHGSGGGGGGGGEGGSGGGGGGRGRGRGNGGGGGGRGGARGRGGQDGQSALLRHQLRSYGAEGYATLRLFMAVAHCPANDVRYDELSVHAALGESLVGKALIEHPTLHIALPHEVSRFPLRD